MTTTSTTTDSIEKQVVLRAPRTRVWRALTQTQEFNEWFGVELQGSFAKGARLRGGIRHPGYQHLTMEIDRGGAGRAGQRAVRVVRP